MKPSGEVEVIFKNNRVYTGDHVLVRIIRVTYNKTPIAYIRKHFLKFGAIEKFKCVYECKPYQDVGEKRIYITYVEPESACKAVYMEQQFPSKLVSVSRAHSWLQPDNDKAVRVGEEIKAPTTNQSLNMLQLPVLCIEAILERLEVSDQIRFIRAHGNLQTVFETYCRRRYRKFDLTETKKMTMWEILNFLGIAGKYIVEISGELPFNIADYVIDTLADFCPYLECVSFYNSIISQDTLQNFFKNLKNLREVNLTKVDDLNERTLCVLNGAKNLKTINLKSMGITGKYLKTVRRTEHLSLQLCYSITIRNLVDACIILKKLRSLDVRDIHLNPYFFKVIDQHCQQLETLKMTEQFCTYDSVALLPRLKHLEVRQYNAGLRVEILSTTILAQHKADILEVLKINSTQSLTSADIPNISKLLQLKVLSIPYVRDQVPNVSLAQLGELKLLEELVIAGCKNVTNEVLLCLLRKLPNLHTLDIQFCREITNDFIEAIALMLRDNWRKFTVYTYCTSVKRESLLQSPAIKEAVERFGLKLMFEFKDPIYQD